MDDAIIDILILPFIWLVITIVGYKTYRKPNGEKDFLGCANAGLWGAILIGGVLFSVGWVG